MPRYFFDLDNGKANYVDTIGTELDDQKMVQREAIGFLASVFKDAAHDDGAPVHLVSVRDEAGRVIFTTALTLQSDWRDQADRVGANCA
jgi:hypothetical protein